MKKKQSKGGLLGREGVGDRKESEKADKDMSIIRNNESNDLSIN